MVELILNSELFVLLDQGAYQQGLRAQYTLFTYCWKKKDSYLFQGYESIFLLQNETQTASSRIWTRETVLFVFVFFFEPAYYNILCYILQFNLFYHKDSIYFFPVLLFLTLIQLFILVCNDKRFCLFLFSNVLGVTISRCFCGGIPVV